MSQQLTAHLARFGSVSLVLTLCACQSPSAGEPTSGQLTTSAPSGEPSAASAAASGKAAPPSSDPSELEDADFGRDWTLLVHATNELVAELIFANNQLTRVDYRTQDEAQKRAFERRLDTVMATAKREGLRVKFHDARAKGERGHLIGGRPKPGETFFVLALREHLGDDTFKVSAK
ncbi:MAG: hypothetical protein KF915_18470 [Polyangiaceae bacterium]|nr:hypothetical protein [Polyangiaceae bacterium]